LSRCQYARVLDLDPPPPPVATRSPLCHNVLEPELAHAREGRLAEAGDAEFWSSLHSDDFEQIELWSNSHPPSDPRKRTKQEVAAIVDRAPKNGVQFRVENMVGDADRLAYTVTCILPNGRTVIANDIADIRDGLIVKELVVEAGEPDD
jgi:hypothetical protein